jgi:hypothetical protein
VVCTYATTGILRGISTSLGAGAFPEADTGLEREKKKTI